MSVFKRIFKLVEEAIFWRQARNTEQVIRYVRQNSNFRSLDPKEIERIMHQVCTQYQPKEQ